MSIEQNLLRALDVEGHVQNVLMIDIAEAYAELRHELDKIGIDGKTLMEWEGRPGLVHALEPVFERIPQAERDKLVQRRKERMASQRDAETEAWQKRAGIEPATGERERLLCEMSEKAYELIKVVELERSGIRDGDGSWHGSDVVGNTMKDLRCLFQLLDELDRRNRESACDDPDAWMLDDHARRGGHDDETEWP